MVSRADQASKKLVENAVVVVALQEIRAFVVLQAELVIDKVKLVGPDPDDGSYGGALGMQNSKSQPGS